MEQGAFVFKQPIVRDPTYIDRMWQDDSRPMTLAGACGMNLSKLGKRLAGLKTFSSTKVFPDFSYLPRERPHCHQQLSEGHLFTGEVNYALPVSCCTKPVSQEDISLSHLFSPGATPISHSFLQSRNRINARTDTFTDANRSFAYNRCNFFHPLRI